MKPVIADPPPASFATERWFFLIAIALVVACTLAPFDFSPGGTEVAKRVAETGQTTVADAAVELTAHFIAFFVLGTAAAFVDGSSLRTSGFGRLLVLVLLFCGGLEWVQTFLISRHAHVLDFLCNSTGVLLGVTGWVHWRPLRNVRVALLGWGRGLVVPLQRAVLILGLSLWCAAGFRPLLGALELNWNDTYRLVIANETDGTRPWVGEIEYVGIYEKALTAEQVWMSHDSGSLRRSPAVFREMGLLVGYDFHEPLTNVVIPDGRLRASDFSFPIPRGFKRTNSVNGIFASDGVPLVTVGSVTGMTHAIQSSGEFSIEAWVRPASQLQRGPARIVSLSDGVSKRNFTLAQEAASGVFRVRNGINGINGRRYALYAGGVFQDSLQQLVATYDHGVSSLFRDGRRVAPVVDLREPPVYLMLGVGDGGRIMGALLLILLLAVPVGSLCEAKGLGWHRHPVAAVFTLFAGGLPYAVVCLCLGGGWRFPLLLWLALALLIVYPICVLYTRAPCDGTVQ